VLREVKYVERCRPEVNCRDAFVVVFLKIIRQTATSLNLQSLAAFRDCGSSFSDREVTGTQVASTSTST